MPNPTNSAAKPTRKSQLISLLRAKGGKDIAAISEKFGWQVTDVEAMRCWATTAGDHELWLVPPPACSGSPLMMAQYRAIWGALQARC